MFNCKIPISHIPLQLSSQFFNNMEIGNIWDLAVTLFRFLAPIGYFLLTEKCFDELFLHFWGTFSEKGKEVVLECWNLKGNLQNTLEG